MVFLTMNFMDNMDYPEEVVFSLMLTTNGYDRGLPERAKQETRIILQGDGLLRFLKGRACLFF